MILAPCSCGARHFLFYCDFDAPRTFKISCRECDYTMEAESKTELITKWNAEMRSKTNLEKK